MAGSKGQFATIVSCMISCKGKILLLQRSRHESHPGRWCLPGGHQEKGETPLLAIIREVREETALEVSNSNISLLESCPGHAGRYWIHAFYLEYPGEIPPVTLNPYEHTRYLWVTPNEIHTFHLIPGQAMVLRRLGIDANE
jgi:8-oxo-dGTP diphosphatase